VKASGPTPVSSRRDVGDGPLDAVEAMRTELGAETRTVGEGQSQMVIMSDEIPNLERMPAADLPRKVIALSDPDIGSKWAEIASRYGGRWVYPIVRGNSVCGAVEMWEMSGCVEIRAMDLNSPDLLPETLEALDRMMGFFRMKGFGILRIREILGVDAADLDDAMRSALGEAGYSFINGFWAAGDFVPWTMTMQEMLSYIFRRQRIAKGDRFHSAAEAMDSRGYIRNDQELTPRVEDKTGMKRLLERGNVVKMTLSPPYQGFTTLRYAPVFRAEKAAKIEGPALDLLRLIKDRQPVSKREIADRSQYSVDITSEALNYLSKSSVLYQDGDSMYNLVPNSGMSQFDAAKEIAKMHFGFFGVFSAEELSSFLSARMPTVRAVLRSLEDEGFLRKGFFLEGDPALRWMLSEDVGKRPEPFTDQFLLNTQDNLHIYLRALMKEQVPTGRCIIFSGTRPVGSFKGKVCPTGVKVEDFEGSSRAMSILKGVAEISGVSLETERQREDDDWSVSESYIKFNPGA
jgi:ATP-dependent Lhr-like helicase